MIVRLALLVLAVGARGAAVRQTAAPPPGGLAAAWVPALSPVFDAMRQETSRDLTPALANLLKLDLQSGPDIRRLTPAVEQLRRAGLPTPEHFESVPAGERRATLIQAVWQASRQAMLDDDKVFPPRGGQSALSPPEAYERAERSLLENGPYLSKQSVARLEAELPRLLKESKIPAKTVEATAIDIVFAGVTQWTPDIDREEELDSDRQTYHERLTENLNKAARKGDAKAFWVAYEAGVQPLYDHKRKIWAETSNSQEGPRAVARRWSEFHAIVERYFATIHRLRTTYGIKPKAARGGPMQRDDYDYLHLIDHWLSPPTRAQERAAARAAPSAWALKAYEAKRLDDQKMPGHILRVVDYYKGLPQRDHILDEGSGPFPSLHDLRRSWLQVATGTGGREGFLKTLLLWAWAAGSGIFAACVLRPYPLLLLGTALALAGLLRVAWRWKRFNGLAPEISRLRGIAW